MSGFFAFYFLYLTLSPHGADEYLGGGQAGFAHCVFQDDGQVGIGEGFLAHDDVNAIVGDAYINFRETFGLQEGFQCGFPLYAALDFQFVVYGLLPLGVGNVVVIDDFR